MPSAHRRARTSPVAETGPVTLRMPKLPVPAAGATPPPPPPPPAAAAGLPPLPGNYVWALVAMLAGVIGLHLLGATVHEAIAVVEALVVPLGILVWRRRK